MTDILMQPEPQTEDKEAIDQTWAEIEALNEQMRQDQIIIDSLKIETAAYKTKSACLKAQIDRLKAEGDVLAAQNRVTLNRLTTMVDKR